MTPVDVIGIALFAAAALYITWLNLTRGGHQ